MKRTILAATLGAALLTLPYLAYAHHAFNAEYDAEKPVTLVGVLTKVDQQNPHGWFYIDVKPSTPGGRVVNWALETPGPNQLVNTGFVKAMYEEMVAKKEVVTVKGYAAKDGSKQAFAETLTRADGRTVVTISDSGVRGQVGGLRGKPAGQNITVDGVTVDQGPLTRGGAPRGGGVGGGAPRGGGGGGARGGGGAPRGTAPAPAPGGGN